MEVILRQAVEKLGHPGDIVKVSAGYARNYLLPRGFAYEATAGNRKRIEQERQRLEQAEEARRGSASELATKLEQVSLTFWARSRPQISHTSWTPRDSRSRSGRSSSMSRSVPSESTRCRSVFTRMSTPRSRSGSSSSRSKRKRGPGLALTARPGLFM